MIPLLAVCWRSLCFPLETFSFKNMCYYFNIPPTSVFICANNLYNTSLSWTVIPARDAAELVLCLGVTHSGCKYLVHYPRFIKWIQITNRILKKDKAAWHQTLMTDQCGNKWQCCGDVVSIPLFRTQCLGTRLSSAGGTTCTTQVPQWAASLSKPVLRFNAPTIQRLGLQFTNKSTL